MAGTERIATGFLARGPAFCHFRREEPAQHLQRARGGKPVVFLPAQAVS